MDDKFEQWPPIEGTPSDLSFFISVFIAGFIATLVFIV